jgi:hypothetical protein
VSVRTNIATVVGAAIASLCYPSEQETVKPDLKT